MMVPIMFFWVFNLPSGIMEICDLSGVIIKSLSILQSAAIPYVGPNIQKGKTPMTYDLYRSMDGGELLV